jgi:minor extracellular serine protease Vpr
MKSSVRFLLSFILLLLAASLTFGGTLSQQQQRKLDRFFKSVIAQQFPDLLQARYGIMKSEEITNPTATTRYDAIVYTQDANSVRALGLPVNSAFSGFITTQVTASDLVRLSGLESVKFIERGSTNYPQLDVSVPETGASLVQSGFINGTSYKGAGAIVLIYDTGIDWKHLDFRKSDTTKSRILFIWDQTLTPIGSETSPAGLGYGVEYTQAQIENELDGSPAGFVREMDIHGHGTHVASTAAGNGRSINNKYVGMAPDADIIVVKGGDGSFNETKMIDGLTYAQNKATALGKPIVINWSIGGHDGPHDGTLAYEVAVDNFVATPGRVVCISAGNSGADSIHISGTAASGSPSSFSITVPTYTPHSGTKNDYFYLPLWFRDAQAVDVTVTSPSSIIYTCLSDSSGTAPSKTDGTIEVTNHISGINSNRTIEVYVYDSTANVPKNGTWTITLTRPSGSVVYDGWLTYSDLGGVLAKLPAGNTSKTVGMPGTSKGAITVGAYASKWYWYSYNNTGAWSYGPDRTDNIATFSSIGPTGDGRMKPDIASPGQIIVAALSSGVDTLGAATMIVSGQKHQIMQGTSMACPHVTGGTALLLGANPSLTAAQIKTLYTSTANSDAYAAGLPNNIWGYGKFDVLEAMAKSIFSGATVTRTTLAYDGTSGSSFVRITGTTKAAVRFTPTTTGQLTGIQVYITSLPNRPIQGAGPLLCEIYTNNAGLPGTKIGSTVSQPFSMLAPFTNNYIQMISANVNVTSGTDYHVVLSVANATDSVLVRCENVITGTHSLTYNGSSWSTQTYNFRIRSIVASTSGMTGVNETVPLLQPLIYTLNQNYPNPFNPSTKISYSIPTASKVTLRIFNLLGQLVSTLVDEQQEANTYVKEFDASRLASGTYFYQLNAGTYSSTKKMLLMK